ncbi:ankyrin repeat-containing domain protein [Podospora didyma]|uniref:Ankyrin repeat-containing domain protein n=1 Tax=Podospora didyma TaxID=330526 RepID=A0AAE0TVQ7_9PEZI|nr:ankyrin repeat-containing domain protein [Podospora didyma]
MASSPRSLYDEALDIFKKSASNHYHDPKDQQSLADFLNQHASPQESQEAVMSLKADAGKKYGSRKVGDVTIPDTWIANILGNINNFVDAGNFAMKGAPESVGLAWFAVKLTLSAIQSNYELYTFFGTGLTDITEIMLIVRHYDRLYDERGKPHWKASSVVEKLFQDVKAAYRAVLDFSFSIKLHLTAGTLTRIKHGFKDFFGISKDKFVGKLAAIAELKKKIVEGSQAAFQDKTLTQLDGVSNVLAGIADTVKNIESFQETQEKFHHESMQRFDEIKRSLEEFKAATKNKTPWDFALEKFQKHRDALSPLKSSGEALSEAIDARYPGTCQWIIESSHSYRDWEDSDENNILCISGHRGTGKSTVLATVVDHLGNTSEASKPLFYLSCQTRDANGLNSAQVHSADRICNTFLYNLYKLATEDEQNTHLLEACNEVFANPKAKATRVTSKFGKTNKDDELPDFADAFAQVAVRLKQSVILVLDGIDKNLPEKEQVDLFEKLQDLMKTDDIMQNTGVQVKVIVACDVRTKFFSLIGQEFPEACVDINTWNREDINTVVTAALKNVPGLSAAEQEEARVAIIDEAGYRFNYAVSAAIPFIQQPFQRPLSKRLEALPGGMSDTYTEALRQMSPNYVELLRTAVTWVLLSPEVPLGYPKASEIMDAFQGVYDTPVDPGVDTEPMENPEFPAPSRLLIEQLQGASGPFIEMIPTSFQSEEQWVYAPNQQVEEFCFNQAKRHDHKEMTNDQNTLCLRCKSALSESTDLYIDKKEGHLQMALTCVRHLNHPLFQARAGLLAGKQKETEKDEATASAQLEDETTKDKVNEETIKETEEPNEYGYETDDSRDEEKFLSGEQEEEQDGAGDVDAEENVTVRLRYEIQYWPYHLREAESLWPVEERAGNATWAALMAELDKFASAVPDIFATWAQAYYKTIMDMAWLYNFLMYPGNLPKPLHIAANLGLTSWAEHLLDRGEDVNGLMGEDPPLQLAAYQKNNHEMLKLLLTRGGDIMAATPNTEPAFHYWLVREPDISVDAVQLMLDHGAKPDGVNGAEKYTALFYYAMGGKDPAVLQLLLKHGADINATNAQKITPLHMLLSRREVPRELLEAFVSNGADVNAEDDESVRPLQMASVWGELENLKILLRPGVEEIDDTDNDGNTALHQATINKHAACVRLLAEAGADPNLSNKRGRAGIHHAAAGGARDCVEVLLEYDKSHNGHLGINDPDKSGRTPFFFACDSQDEDTACLILDALLERNIPLAEINKPSATGRTPLGMAAARGFSRVLSKLKDTAMAHNNLEGLAINTQDSRKGMTPLHRAAIRGQVDCVRLLLAMKADATVAEKLQSRTALVLAYEQWAVASERTSYEETIALLIEHDPSGAVHDAELAAICAANGSVRLLRQLWSLNADLNRRDRYGWTPLELARKSSQTSAAEFLKQQAAWVGLLPAEWATTFPATTVLGARAIRDDGTTLIWTDRSAVTFAADKPLPAGLEKFYFEITLQAPPSSITTSTTATEDEDNFSSLVAIGFSTIGGAAMVLPGHPHPHGSGRSWAWHADDGGLYASERGDQKSEYLEWRYKVGDTVGCGVDLSTQEIWFTLNGKRRDEGFRGVDGRMFPVVGFRDAEVQVVTNFGGEVFVWRGLREEYEEKVDTQDTDKTAGGQKEADAEGSGSGPATFVEEVPSPVAVEPLAGGELATAKKFHIEVTTQAIVEGIETLAVS